MKTFLSTALRLAAPALILGLISSSFAGPASETEFESRGRQFVGFSSFTNFERAEASNGPITLTSPGIHSRIPFNEVVVSWDADVPAESSLSVEARALYGERGTKYYKMGIWSTSWKQHPRKSVIGQRDSDGDVSTDTLILEQAADCLRVRVVMTGEGESRPSVRFLGISLADNHAQPGVLPADRSAWGKVIPVPERTQMIYPNGKTLCSPTTVSMLMGYWAERLKRPKLDEGVPKIVEAIYDAEWRGAGNWAFNMAYAGSFPGLRAYVTRLSDVSELEEWVARDIPVGMSVDYDRLRAKGPGPNGHLVVCVGFTKDGDPIINDPGTSKHVRKVFPRRNLIDAWACSRNTVYLVYPENSETPEDRFGHWDSKTARQWNPFRR